ncbi:MAG: hypothetical protein WCL29_00210 [Pseudomonadota bacterium]
MSAALVSFPTAQIRQEWCENRRLRYGVYVAIGIVWLYGILILREAVVNERDAWQNTESRVARARATATSADWLTRAQDVTTSMGDHESLLWREGSIGLSQAAFQERIMQSFTSANIVVRALKVASANDAPVSSDLIDIVPLRARAQVEFRPSSFYPWLGALAKMRLEKRPAVAIESMTIRASSFGQPAIADVELIGYVLRGAAPIIGTAAVTAPPPVPPVSTSGVTK